MWSRYIPVTPRTNSLSNKCLQVLLKSTGTSAKLFPDASYIVVGGLGGIGRFITQMLVERGAKHLILISRSAASRPSSQIF